MTFVPPLGASAPPVLSEATPATANGPDSGGDMQALFADLSYSQLGGEFMNPEVLGALSAQGTATLRDFLARAKKLDSLVNARGRKGSNSAGGDVPLGDGPLHGGPAREPFERQNAMDEPVHNEAEDRYEEVKRFVEDLVDRSLMHQQATFEVTLVASMAKQINQAIGELIKGQ